MAEPQVPANAVPEAQAVLQNDPPPDAAQGAAIPAAQAQADEISLEVCKVLFSLFFATCFVPVFMCLVCFGFTVLFYFVRPGFHVCPFSCGLCGPFCNFVYCLPCFQRFAPFVGFVGYIWIGLLFALLLMFAPFHVGFAGHFNFVRCLPCCQCFAPLWALWAISGLVCYSPCF